MYCKYVLSLNYTALFVFPSGGGTSISTWSCEPTKGKPFQDKGSSFFRSTLLPQFLVQSKGSKLYM